jgi:hypothetical protein
MGKHSMDRKKLKQAKMLLASEMLRSWIADLRFEGTARPEYYAAKREMYRVLERSKHKQIGEAWVKLTVDGVMSVLGAEKLAEKLVEETLKAIWEEAGKYGGKKFKEWVEKKAAEGDLFVVREKTPDKGAVIVYTYDHQSGILKMAARRHTARKTSSPDGLKFDLEPYQAIITVTVDWDATGKPKAVQGIRFCHETLPKHAVRKGVEAEKREPSLKEKVWRLREESHKRSKGLSLNRTLERMLKEASGEERILGGITEDPGDPKYQEERKQKLEEREKEADLQKECSEAKKKAVEAERSCRDGQRQVEAAGQELKTLVQRNRDSLDKLAIELERQAKDKGVLETEDLKAIQTLEERTGELEKAWREKRGAYDKWLKKQQDHLDALQGMALDAMEACLAPNDRWLQATREERLAIDAYTNALLSFKLSEKGVTAEDVRKAEAIQSEKEAAAYTAKAELAPLEAKRDEAWDRYNREKGDEALKQAKAERYREVERLRQEADESGKKLRALREKAAKKADAHQKRRDERLRSLKQDQKKKEDDLRQRQLRLEKEAQEVCSKSENMQEDARKVCAELQLLRTRREIAVTKGEVSELIDKQIPSLLRSLKLVSAAERECRRIKEVGVQEIRVAGETGGGTTEDLDRRRYPYINVAFTVYDLLNLAGDAEYYRTYQTGTLSLPRGARFDFDLDESRIDTLVTKSAGGKGGNKDAVRRLSSAVALISEGMECSRIAREGLLRRLHPIVEELVAQIEALERGGHVSAEQYKKLEELEKRWRKLGLEGGWATKVDETFKRLRAKRRKLTITEPPAPPKPRLTVTEPGGPPGPAKRRLAVIEPGDPPGPAKRRLTVIEPGGPPGKATSPSRGGTGWGWWMLIPIVMGIGLIVGGGWLVWERTQHPGTGPGVGIATVVSTYAAPRAATPEQVATLTPTTDVVLAPTPSSVPGTPLPEAAQPNYSSPDLGLSMWYPDRWIYEQKGAETLFASSQETIGEIDEEGLMGVEGGEFVLVTRVDLEGGLSVGDVVETFAELLASGEQMERGDPQLQIVGGQSGVILFWEGTPPGSEVPVSGFVAAVEREDSAYVFLGTAPYTGEVVGQPSFDQLREAMLDSVQFVAPSAPTSTESSTPTPTPVPPTRTAAPALPVITSIEFPDKISASGSSVGGRVHFRDPDGDVNWVAFDVVSAEEFQGFQFNPLESLDAGDATDGAFLFNIWCERVQRVTLRVTLSDASGNRSVPVDLRFSCE